MVLSFLLLYLVDCCYDYSDVVVFHEFVFMESFGCNLCLYVVDELHID